jgi:hypothetical protein
MARTRSRHTLVGRARRYCAFLAPDPDDDAVAPERFQGCHGGRIENHAAPGIPKLPCDTSRYLIGILTGHRRSANVIAVQSSLYFAQLNGLGRTIERVAFVALK